MLLAQKKICNYAFANFIPINGKPQGIQTANFERSAILSRYSPI